jgi:hypothetical protein
LEARVRQLGTIRLRRIDVPTWDSQVSRQHGIRRLPTLMLYAGRRLLSSDTAEILAWLQREPRG